MFQSFFGVCFEGLERERGGRGIDSGVSVTRDDAVAGDTLSA
jgi:hypothetical protein